MCGAGVMVGKWICELLFPAEGIVPAETGVSAYMMTPADAVLLSSTVLLYISTTVLTFSTVRLFVFTAVPVVSTARLLISTMALGVSDARLAAADAGGEISETVVGVSTGEVGFGFFGEVRRQGESGFYFI